MAETANVRLHCAGGVATVTLAAPARHNCLVPALLGDLLSAVHSARATAPRVVVIAAEGRSFSTGGDLAALLAVPRHQRRAYAGDLVGRLNAVILALIDCPAPVIARVQGAVTGGSAGLVFAADDVVMAGDAFLQPWYSAVGFAPDGGWTVMLPERIGPARAARILGRNMRLTAPEALALGLADAVVPAADLEAAVAERVDAYLAKDAASLAVTRRLLCPPERRAMIATGLERERAAFVDLVATDAAETGMQRMLDTWA